MLILKKIASIAVLLIGLYMLITYWGAVSPPMLSGVAFTLLGAMQTHKVFVCCKGKSK